MCDCEDVERESAMPPDSVPVQDFDMQSSSEVRNRVYSRFKSDGKTLQYTTYPVDEIVPLDVLQELSTDFQDVNNWSETTGKTETVNDNDTVVNFDRWEIRGDVHTVRGGKMQYNVKTLVFEPGGRLFVHASVWFILNVQDMFIQSPSLPGQIIIDRPEKPRKRPTGATGTRGTDGSGDGAPGGPGGPGHYGLQGSRGITNKVFYLICNRLDHAYPLTITNIGGDGGDGSDGGRGGLGGNGASGRDAIANGINCVRGCTRGGRCGSGGYGGYPHYGGTGGDGGQIWLQGPEVGFLDRARNFGINNLGGAGGRRGNPGSGGNVGNSGRPGSSSFPCSQCPDTRCPIAGGSTGPIGDVKDGPAGSRGLIRQIPT